MNKGKFIIIEGLDGSGKTIQTKMLVDKLIDSGVMCYRTKEPTDNPIGKLIKQEYLSGKSKCDDRTLAALFAADRMDHYLGTFEDPGIIDLLQNGLHVISDRSYITSLAYQGMDTYENFHFVKLFNKPCAELLSPDLIIYININPIIAHDRILRNRKDKEIYDLRSSLIINHENYHKTIEYLKSCNENVCIVNGDCTIENLHKQILMHVKDYLNGVND